MVDKINLIYIIILINSAMKHLVKIYEETKKFNSDLTQYKSCTEYIKRYVLMKIKDS